MSAQYFTGYYRIAQDVYTNEQLTEFITKYEKKYLIDLLGYDLYLLFMANFTNGIPQSARFTVIYDELHHEGNGGAEIFYPIDLGMSPICNHSSLVDTGIEEMHSDGISPMLKGFVFFHFVNEYDLSVSPTGVITNSNENSDKGARNRTLALIESKYNDSIASYKTIRAYILDNIEDYPEFNGAYKDTVHFGGAF